MITRLVVSAALVCALSSPVAALELIGRLKLSDFPDLKEPNVPLVAHQNPQGEFEVWLIDHGGCDAVGDLGMALSRRAIVEHGTRIE